MNPFQIWVRRLRERLTTPQRRQPIRLDMLALEDRAVPAGLDVRSIDGSGNNLANLDWGSTGQQFLRVADAAYADGISTVGGTDRPSARVISNTVSDQVTKETSDRFLSAMVYAWGQFIDHDLDLTNTGSEPLKIPVPTGDPSFDPFGTGIKTISTTRSVYDPATGTDASNPRQQINAISAWMDGSMVYGSDTDTAAKLRSFSGGRMKMSADGMLPLNNAANFPTGTVAQAGIGVVPADKLYAAGDVRANENPELTSLQTLFIREHNRIAGQIAARDPSLSDEQIYQQARAVVIGEIQAITYNEWLPTVFGRDAMPGYTGYKPDVNPNISNEFSTAGFRFGHSLIGDDIEFLDNNGNPVRDSVALSAAFFNPTLIANGGIDPVLKYLATDHSSELDTQVVDSVRNFLFGPPGAGGLDLASLNIQRGRDHGLADYNTTREAYGLPRVTSFSEITANVDMQGKLQQLYGSVDNIDLWVGVLAEDHVKGASVGPTARAIMVDQFTRLRDGDRFWYQNSFHGAQRDQIEHTTLADVVRRNTDLTVLQPNLFVFRGGTVQGTVFADGNRNGTQDASETGIEGMLVFADLNRNGKADRNEPQMKTGANGSYSLVVPVEGSVAILVAPPPGPGAPPPLVKLVNIAAGADAVTANFGIGAVKPPPVKAPPPPIAPADSKAPPPPLKAPETKAPPPPMTPADSKAPPPPLKAPDAKAPPLLPPPAPQQGGPAVNVAPPPTNAGNQPPAPAPAPTTPPPPRTGTTPPPTTPTVPPPPAAPTPPPPTNPAPQPPPAPLTQMSGSPPRPGAPRG